MVRIVSVSECVFCIFVISQTEKKTKDTLKMPLGNSTKGLRFLARNKAVVDLHRHADIMEDAIDRITIKEAMRKGEFVPWDEVEKKVNRKLGVHHGLHGTTNKTGRKKPAKS